MLTVDCRTNSHYDLHWGKSMSILKVATIVLSIIYLCSDVKAKDGKYSKGEADNTPRMPITRGLPRSISCILFSSSQRPSLPLHFRYIKHTPSNLRLHNAIPGGGLLGGGRTQPKDLEENSLSEATSMSQQDTMGSSEIVILSDSSITSCTTMDSPQSR